MGFFLFSLFLFSLTIAMNEAGEYCTNNIYCPNYCCSNVCCDSPFSITTSDPQVNPGNVVIYVIIGIVGFILLTITISLIVACCCRCICSSNKEGQVIAQPTAAVTVTNQYRTYNPPPQYTYPQSQVTYPPAQIGNSNYQRTAYVIPPPYGGKYLE